MAAWKVVVIGLCACVCLALGLATLLVPISGEGNQKWLLTAGLLVGTLCAGGLFTLFLRYAGRSLDFKPRGWRN